LDPRTHLHLNPVGGLAGDMFCAALLDIQPALIDDVREAIESLAMPVPVRIELHDAGQVVHGRYFRVAPENGEYSHARHTPFHEIRNLLEQAPLAPGVRTRALDVFRLLAEAEGRVHGIDAERVHFHEVGAWDSIADVVAAAFLLDALDVQGASCDPLPLGGGRVRSAHGMLPVPAPATTLLLQGLAVTDDGVPGERVTPTGAAILKSLQPLRHAPPGMLRATGTGFGSRTLPGVPNCIQILCIEPEPDVPLTESKGGESDRVITLRFDVDDQAPEDFAVAVDHLRAMPGVLSATTFSGIGKHGRPTMAVEVLARPERANAVAEACFRETTTIGLRWQASTRLVLPRQHRRVIVEEHELDVKLVQRPDGADAKAEMRNVADRQERAQRDRLRKSAAESALREIRDDE
jgi:uncharacterized protein (TIGR00299 family) protein